MDPRVSPHASPLPVSGALRPGLDAAVKRQAKAAAEEFEAVFIANMLEGMFSGVEAEPPFGGGESEKTYRGLLVAEYAGEIARGGGIGIADHVYREILLAQEGLEP